MSLKVEKNFSGGIFMLFYECNVSYKAKIESRLAELANQPKKIWGDAIIQDMNDTLAENSADKIEILICSAKIGGGR